MAKITLTFEVDDVHDIAIPRPKGSTDNPETFETYPEEIHANALQYVFMYGLRQTMKDSAADVGAARTRKDSPYDSTWDDIDVARDLMTKRYEALKSGDIRTGHGGGATLDPVTKQIRANLVKPVRQLGLAPKGKNIETWIGQNLSEVLTKVANARGQDVDEFTDLVRSVAERQVKEAAALEIEITPNES